MIFCFVVNVLSNHLFRQAFHVLHQTSWAYFSLTQMHVHNGIYGQCYYTGDNRLALRVFMENFEEQSKTETFKRHVTNSLEHRE